MSPGIGHSQEGFCGVLVCARSRGSVPGVDLTNEFDCSRLIFKGDKSLNLSPCPNSAMVVGPDRERTTTKRTSPIPHTEPAFPNGDRSPSFGSRCCGPVRKKSKKKKRVWSQEQKYNTHVDFGHKICMKGGTALAVRNAHSSSRTGKKPRGPPGGSTDPQDTFPLVLKNFRRSRNKRLSSIDVSAQLHRALCAFSLFFHIPGCPGFCGQCLTCTE